MTAYEYHSLLLEAISIGFSFTATICSVIAIVYTAKNLKEIRKQFYEQNRGNLVFYITKDFDSLFHSTIIKNFGNSPARLLSLNISPELDWEKAGSQELNGSVVSNMKNIFLAPGQYVASAFDFRKYPDIVFEVEVKYETCGKQFTEAYSINLNYNDYAIHLEPSINDTVSGLKNIYKIIRSLNEKFI